MAGHAVCNPADGDLPVPPSGHAHGSLSHITDSERRALRSIGTTAREVADRTDALLADLLAVPGVSIFQGVRLTASAPRIPHAVSAGHQLFLVESVAWPPGRYCATATGRVYCDGAYIGQSAGPLLQAVGHWRRCLPRGHHVCALVVVHGAGEGDLVLPRPTGRTLSWVGAKHATQEIRLRLTPGPLPFSKHIVQALATAIADESR
jgi:hypothetical protein